ncbi:hypothetical protein C6495_02230 [Candidatus Poribacteria bacterium]|nr:MAG: hypothetical protein C6495_02230 [Candidatus Poribacteria bacterium]
MKPEINKELYHGSEISSAILYKHTLYGHQFYHHSLFFQEIIWKNLRKERVFAQINTVAQHAGKKT